MTRSGGKLNTSPVFTARGFFLASRMNIGTPMKFYTYVHMRADDGKVFYVGKGAGRRATAHSQRNPHWHSTVKKHGIRVEIAAYWPSEAEAFSHERLLISVFRDIGHPMTNRSDGGDGGGKGGGGAWITPEDRARLTALQTGRKASPETRARISAARKGIKTGPPSEETRAKIAASNTGKKNLAVTGDKNPMHRPDVKAKVSVARKGVPWTAAQRAADTGKKRPSMTGDKNPMNNPEARAKVSAAQKGIKKGPWTEARRKAQEARAGKPNAKRITPPWTEERKAACKALWAQKRATA